MSAINDWLAKNSRPQRDVYFQEGMFGAIRCDVEDFAVSPTEFGITHNRVLRSGTPRISATTAA